MYPEISNPSKCHHSERWNKRPLKDVFKCIYCGAHVYSQPIISGVKNRNHCPFCLSSRHVDHAQAGDRMSACKAIMQPIGLTVKRSQNKYGSPILGELMVIHRCETCGKLSINRIAADDQVDRLMEIFYTSTRLDLYMQDELITSGISILQPQDWKLVVGQLQGITQF